MIFDERLFRLCLHLYPASFRQDFGEEMLDTYQARRLSTHTTIGKCGVILHEILDIFPNSLMLHYDSYCMLPVTHKSLIQARWMIRVASLLVTLFFISVSLDSYTTQPKPENLVMVVLFGLQIVCVLFALKWERIGAIIMLTTTFTVALIIFEGMRLPNYEYLAFFAAILWATPFIGFAIGYFMLGHKQVTLQQQVIA